MTSCADPLRSLVIARATYDESDFHDRHY